MRPPLSGGEWLALTQEPLDTGEAGVWVREPRCGAVVTFTGTTRDHAEGRAGVTHLDYEAYEEHVVPRLAAVVEEARARWPEIGRMVLWHRVGRVPVTEPSVVVAVAAPHRDEAFAAARFGIDTLKATVPIWKRETWAEGSEWASGAHDVVNADAGGRPNR